MNKSHFSARRFLPIFLGIICLVVSMPIRVMATDFEVPVNRRVFVNGIDTGYIMTMNYYYDHDVYVSIRGITSALTGTEKAVTLTLAGGEISVHSGGNTGSPQAYQWTEEDLLSPLRIDVGRHKLFMDGQEKKYYSVKKGMPDGSVDYFFSLIDIAMLYNLHVSIAQEIIYIDTTKDFSVTPQDIIDSGYLQGVNGLVIGDASTGDIYLAHDADHAFAIASTTKLMTYLLVKEALENEEITMRDMVTITDTAETISRSVDGVIAMKAGTQIPIGEIIYGSLLPSSNECAYSLAVHVAGSEEAFVERMNRKAEELSLTTAQFYNSHGLPLYQEQLIPGKVQNHMSARDMFTLAGYIVQKYPEIIEITSQKEMWLPNLGTNVRNTNVLLYNMPEMKGLKTGTTNKAGACLVTYLPVIYEGKEHKLIVAMLGAETNIDRETVAELSSRCALMQLMGGASISEYKEYSAEELPEDPEKVMQRLVNHAMNKESM